MTDVNLTYSVGTVSIANGATAVTGVGCLWNTSLNASEWDFIQIGSSNILVPITSLTDDTHLVIPTWQGTTQTAVPYKIFQLSPLRYVGGQTMAAVDDMLQQLNTEGWYRYVNPVYSDPTAAGLSANEGQFALKYTTGQIWIMTSGVWVLVGTFKPFGIAAPYDNAHTYNLNDVATSGGSSYLFINSTPSAGHAPPNATYWAVLASIGNTGPAFLKPIAAWLTGTAYVIGPPADFVSINGASYQCLIPHTSGTFATDLAAGKWGLIASKGTDALTYGGSSATSLAIATGSKDFTDVPLTLAYQLGNYVRASSAANGANFMEGFLTAYSSGHFTLNVIKIGGSGTKTDWKFSISGASGSGDLLAANNGSDFANEDTTLTNLRGVSFGAAQSLTATQAAQARSNVFKAPTRQVLISGTTYTTPSSPAPLYIRGRMVGGGAGGGGSGSGSSGGTGGNGGTTSFNSAAITAPGGGAGAAFTGGAGGAVGSGTGGTVFLAGAAGNTADRQQSVNASASGGNSAFGGAGGACSSDASAVALPGVTNTGGGGGGGGVNAQSTVVSGGGGGSGAYTEFQINAPTTTYTYAIGAGGSAGAAGTLGLAGGAGGSGIIIIDEYYS